MFLIDLFQILIMIFFKMINSPFLEKCWVLIGSFQTNRFTKEIVISHWLIFPKLQQVIVISF